jgi:hypothetical protein
MQKAIDENKIEPVLGGGLEVAHIRHHKIAPVPPPGALYVPLIYVDPEIVRGGKVTRVCSRAAGDVEHSTHTSEVIVGKYGRKLLFRKRSLPHFVYECALKQSLGQTHGAHLPGSRVAPSTAGVFVIGNQMCGVITVVAITATSHDSSYADDTSESLGGDHQQGTAEGDG